MAMIRKAVQLRPDDGYIVDSLGWAHYRLGDFDDAVRELERAVELKPEDPVINDHLGDAYWHAGRRLEARFQWKHARELDPEPEDLKRIIFKLKNGLSEANAEQTKYAAAEAGNASDAAPEEPDEAVAQKGGNGGGESGFDSGKGGFEGMEGGKEPPGPGRSVGPRDTVDPIEPPDRVLAPGAAPPLGGGKTYRVRRGDTLWGLAQRFYGDGNAYRRILDANRDILGNGDRISPGQTIRIP
jgi:tetratricopeptide (TPR) repeat protein